MKIKELREKSDIELEKTLAESRSGLQDRRFAIAGRRLKRVREVRDIRKNIARTLTLIGERKSEKNKQGSSPVEARETGRTEE